MEHLLRWGCAREQNKTEISALGNLLDFPTWVSEAGCGQTNRKPNCGHFEEGRGVWSGKAPWKR